MFENSRSESKHKSHIKSNLKESNLNRRRLPCIWGTVKQCKITDILKFGKKLPSMTIMHIACPVPLVMPNYTVVSKTKSQLRQEIMISK